MESRVKDQVSTSLNPERLRYLTEQFHSLQSGLRGAAIGLWIAVISIEDRYGDCWPARPRWVHLVKAMAFLAFAAAMIFLPKYSRWRFGSLEPRSPTNKHSVIFTSVMCLLVLFGAPLGRYLDSIGTEIWALIPGHAFPFTPAVLLWLAFLCSQLKRNPGLEDRHQTYFSALGVLAWAVIAFCTLHSESMFWKVLSAGWLGFSLIAIGLHDHLTLVRLMPKRNEKCHDDGVDHE